MVKLVFVPFSTMISDTNIFDMNTFQRWILSYSTENTSSECDAECDAELSYDKWAID